MAAHYAANMMIPRESGLIVNISSPGGLSYLFNVPYGIGKEAVSLLFHILLNLLLVKLGPFRGVQE